MKRGAKRPALSDSVPNPTGSTLRSKRVMDAPSFDVHRAESSRQHLMANIPLDVKRAESAQQHVRALNTQFASWVQLQLQNHPDELWEDGVKDYLSHASNIMEKFKDVVDWLRANAAKSGSASAAGSLNDQNNLEILSDNSRPRLYSEMSNGFAQENKPATFSSLQTSSLSGSQSSGLFSISQTPSSFSSLQSSALFNRQSSGPFSTSQTPASFSSLQSAGLSSSHSSGLFSFGQTPPSFSSSGFSSSQNTGFFSTGQTPTSFSSLQSPSLSSSLSSGISSASQTPAFPGTQNFNPPKVEASNDADEENELEQPSSPSLKKAEEKGVIVVHEVKCKVYVKPDNPSDKGWKDMGMGQLSIKCKEGANKAAKESKPTIVIRNDVGKILLNALIYPGIKMNIQKNTIASIFHTASSGVTDGSEAGKSDAVVARTYLLRLKSAEETTKLADAIKEYAPAA